MRIPFKRTYQDGEKPHWAYGLAYWDFWNETRIFFPMPFNLFIRCVRELLFKIRKGWFIGNYRREFYKAYDKGYNDGYKRRKAKDYDEFYKRKSMESTFLGMATCPTCLRDRINDGLMICEKCSERLKKAVDDVQIIKGPTFVFRTHILCQTGSCNCSEYDGLKKEEMPQDWKPHDDKKCNHNCHCTFVSV